MNAMTNPMVLRLLILLGGTVFAFVMSVFMIRHMRRSLVESCASIGEKATLDNLPMHTYHAVIQQLEQQKHELLSTQQVERRRARLSENISASVLSNLSIGVLFFAPQWTYPAGKFSRQGNSWIFIAHRHECCLNVRQYRRRFENSFEYSQDARSRQLLGAHWLT